jgi:similar to stage IV sporulation protein
MLFWIVASGYLWNIRIEGNYVLTEDVLMDYLAEQGVHVPMQKKRLQIEELEEGLREDFDVITWTSLQLEGTTLLVSIKENEMPVYDQDGQQEDAEKGTDLIAERAGTVSYIITRSGVPQVALGDTVEKGDILVSGAVPVYNEDATVRKYQFVNADADITLRYEETFSVTREIAYEVKQYTGRQKVLPLLGAFDREWSIGFVKNRYAAYDVSEEKKQVKLLDHLYLPLYYGQKKVREYETIQQKYTEDEMENLMQEEWSKIISTLEEKGVQITEKNVTIKKNKNNWVLNARMQLEESAVTQSPTKTTQITEDTDEEQEGQ